MIKVSELVSKQLLCLDTASVVGTVSNIIFDERLKSGKLLQLYCEDDETPETRFVELKNVSAAIEDAVVVKSSDFILSEWTVSITQNNPINSSCYNQDGKMLGKVRDILLNGTIVEKIILEDLEFAPKDLLSYSDRLLVFNDSGKPIKITKPKIKFPQPQEYTVANVHSDGQLPPYPIKPLEKIDVPTKIKSADNSNAELSYKFLLGKPVHSSILGKNGKVLIQSGHVVSEDTIKLARENGKLVQLALRAY